MSIEKIVTENAPSAIGPYSQGISTQNLVFVSGQLPLDPKTSKFAGDTIEAQTKQSLENVKAILAQRELDLANVVKATVYLASMDDFAGMNSVYSQYFVEPFPARAAFQVGRLPMDALVEIEVIASK